MARRINLRGAHSTRTVQRERIEERRPKGRAVYGDVEGGNFGHNDVDSIVEEPTNRVVIQGAARNS